MTDSKPVFIAVGHGTTGTPVVQGPFEYREDAREAREGLVKRKDIGGTSILEREIQ